MNNNLTTVAAVQYRPEKGNVEKSRIDIAKLANEAGSLGAKIIVFPEMTTSGYIWKNAEELHPHAENSRGKTYETLSFTARRYQSWIVYGYPEIENNILYNSACIIAPDGEQTTNYRKCCLFESDESWASPGDTRISIASNLGVITPGICMDLNDDGFIDYTRSSDTNIITFCSNWLEEGLDVHSYWVERLAGFGGCFIAANRWGEDCGTAFCGRSAIIANGLVLASAEAEGDCIITAEIII